jgi:hypothetical protein
LEPGSVYVVSVNANSAFGQTVNGLASALVSGPLRTVADGANGVFSDARGSFPNQTWGSSNYFLDVVVRSGAVPFNVSKTSPVAGGAGLVSAVKATFSRVVNASSVSPTSLVVRGSDGTAIAGSVSLDAATSTVSFVPAQPLAMGPYSATVSGVAASDGTVAPPLSWSFTADCPCSLFSDAALPSSQPSGTYELGVKFTVDVPLALTALRFFKASGESGSHVGSVWTASGVRLAQVAFSGESASGWQVQALPSALSLQPGVVYVVSVNANSAFGQTVNGLASSVVSGPLRTVADGANGVYSDARGSFPNQTWGSSNYFIDVVTSRS